MQKNKAMRRILAMLLAAVLAAGTFDSAAVLADTAESAAVSDTAEESTAASDTAETTESTAAYAENVEGTTESTAEDSADTANDICAEDETSAGSSTAGSSTADSSSGGSSSAGDSSESSTSVSVLGFSLSATSGYCGEEVMWKFDEDTGKLTIAGDGEMYNYSPWKSYKYLITSVEVQSGVTTIGSYDFSGYTSLKKVTIASTVKEIGAYAFDGCTSLTSVKISGKKLTTIGTAAFRECTSLTGISLPSSVTTIGDKAFAYAGLTSVTIPAGETSMGTQAFYSCTSLTSAVFKAGAKKIGSKAFSGCTSLKTVSISKTVTSIGTDAFKNCPLTSLKVVSGNTQYYTSSNVLYNKAKTKLILYAQGKTASSFTVPATVETIASEAFKNNTSLKTIYIGTGVTTIESSAFAGCTNLTQIYFQCAAPTISSSSTFDGVTADAFYPLSEAESWASKQEDYGGSLEWSSYLLSASAFTVSLSTTSYVYAEGKTRKPLVTVTVNGRTLTKGADYTVTYADGRSKIGVYAVTVTGIGEYTGETSTTFEIRPAKAVISSAKSSAKKKITVKWKKVAGSVKYEIAYKKKGTSTWKTKKVSAGTLSKTLTGLTSKKTYSIRVRAYKTVNGTTIYGKWSSTKSVKVK